MRAAWFLLWAVPAVCQDVRRRRVSVRLLAAGCVTSGLLAAVWWTAAGAAGGIPAWRTLARTAADGLLPGGVLFAGSALTKGAIGRADAWFLAAAGFTFGAAGAFAAAAFGFILAGLWSMAGLAMGRLHSKSRLPFLPFLYAGTWAVFVMRL